jgi:cell division protein FtsZ
VAHPDANIIFGSNIDEDLGEEVWVTVIATRFDSSYARRFRREAGRSLREPRGPERLEASSIPEFIPGH